MTDSTTKPSARAKARAAAGETFLLLAGLVLDRETAHATFDPVKVLLTVFGIATLFHAAFLPALIALAVCVTAANVASLIVRGIMSTAKKPE